MSHTMTYRPDIDGLRAVAVCAVILFHYFGTNVPSGYLGVDVFFVISGYVITSYLFGAPKDSLSEFLLTFYARRVKRLAPALVVCVVVTAFLFVLVTTRPPREAFASGAWALIGFSNVQLLRSSQDYFALDAQLNPFTQTWSLGVEEQFYLLYPALIAFTGYSWSNRQYTESRAAMVILTLSLVSFCAYALLQEAKPNVAFYLMPPRFWELGAGGLIYLARNFWPSMRQKWIANLSAAALVSCFMLPDHWPVLTTLLVVASASALILTSSPSSIPYKALTQKPIVFVGRISYSLYLWHWSALVLGKWTLGDNVVVLSGLIAFTVLAAVASYFLIEKPLRHAEWSNSNLRTLAMGATLIAPLFFIVLNFIPRYTQSYNNNLPALFGIAPPEPRTANPCHGREALSKLSDPLAFCLAANRSQAKPNVLYLLGDSHAAQIFPMTKIATEGLPITPRFINLEDAGEFVSGFALGVRQSKLLDYVLNSAREGDVVAIAFHRGLLNDSRDKHMPLGAAVPLNERSRNFITAMGPYVDRMTERGLKVILVGDTPLMGAIATSSTCALQLKIFISSICRVTKAQDLHTRSRQDQVFGELARRSEAVFFWDTADDIYGKADYVDVLDDKGHYLMWDWNHLTETAASNLAPSFRRFLQQRVNLGAQTALLP